MDSQKKQARIAGLWYLLMAVTGPVTMMVVPSKVIVRENALETFNNIVNNGLLFRTGIVSGLVCQIAFAFTALALYRLFQDVNIKYSRMLVALVIAAVPVAFLNMLNQVAALILASGAGFLNGFEPAQLHSLTMLFLEIHNHGIVIAGIFWGLWLFPFGYLAYKSGFIPKIIGMLLIINCFAYLIDSFIFLLIPQFYDTVNKILLIPLMAGELPTILWLLIKGVKENKNKEI